MTAAAIADGISSDVGVRQRPSGHLAGLDGIRGLAVLLVMSVHFVGNAPAHALWQKAMVKIAGYGWMGVDLFFVLSGFLITGILLDAKSDPHYFRNFYARRTLRIFPLYYLVLICLFLILPLVVTPSPLLDIARSHQIWVWTYTSNFYIAAVSSWEPLNYVSHFWSLAIEEHFYLVWPLVVFSFSRLALERICIWAIVLAFALRVALGLAGVSELSISVLTPCRVDALCIGAFVALRLRQSNATSSNWILRSGLAALVLGAALAAVMALGAVSQFAAPFLHQVRNSLLAMFFAALVLVSLKPASNILARAFQGRVLGFFGKYSYGLYVYHGILTWYLFEVNADDRLYALFDSHALAFAARILIGFGVSLVVAMLSYNLFEKKFLTLKRYFTMSPDKIGAKA